MKPMTNLENLATEIGKDIKDIKTRYATKEEMHEVAEIDYSQIVTTDELEAKHYLTAHQNISHLATKEEVGRKVDKADFDLLKNDVVKHDELAGRNYLTEHQSLAEYAKKSELYNDSEVKRRLTSLEAKQDKDTVYNDSELRNRISQLERKQDKDTVYDDTLVKQRISALENKPNIDVSGFVTKSELANKNYLTSHQDLSGYARKSELYNDTDIKRRLGLLESRRDNDNQTLSLSGNRLSLTNGGTVELPAPDTPVYRIAKGDIYGANIGSVATIKTTDIMNPDGIKVGDIVEDLWTNNSTVDYEFWKVTAVNGTNINVQKIGKRTFVISYNDTELKRRISVLESRPTFDSLTPIQKNSLRGPQGPAGPKGPQGLTGSPGLRGAPGQNIVNQQNNKELKYWAGTEAQYNAISYKDPNTIYDIFK